MLAAPDSHSRTRILELPRYLVDSSIHPLNEQELVATRCKNLRPLPVLANLRARLPSPMDGTYEESRPDTPTSIEYCIEQLGMTTTALDFLPKKLQRAKHEAQSEEGKLQELAYQNSCLRAENKCFRKVRKAAFLAQQNNLDALVAVRVSAERLSDTLNQIYLIFTSANCTASDYGEDVQAGMESSFQAFTAEFETCRRSLREIQSSGDAFARSYSLFSDTTRQLESEWLECFENKF